MTRYRILSLDGGGVRGLLSAILLKRLEAACPGWLAKADLLAGTSTGGIMALGLAYGLTPEDLRQLYYDKAAYIFDDSWLDDLMDLGQIGGAQYNNRNLQRETRRIWGETRLKDLPKKVLVPAFDLDDEHPDLARRSWKPKFFHNFPGEDSDGEVKCYKVALYTSAAPAYFPSVDGYIDGGVVVNNPSMAALAQTQDRRAEMEWRPTFDDIVLLSIGTGGSLHYVKGKRLDWGFAQWGKPIINILLHGNVGVADYQCRQILDERYQRISPIFEEVIETDNWRRRDELVAIAERQDLAVTVSWLEKYWLAETETPPPDLPAALTNQPPRPGVAGPGS